MLPLFLRELDETRSLLGERFACVHRRKMAAFYLKGKRGAAAWKRKLFAAETTEEVERYAREIFASAPYCAPSGEE